MRVLITGATALALAGGTVAAQDWRSMERPSDWNSDWWTCENGNGAILRNPATNLGGFMARNGGEIMAVDLIFTEGEPYHLGDTFAWKKEGGMGIMIRESGLTDVYVASTTNAPGAVMQMVCEKQ